MLRFRAFLRPPGLWPIHCGLLASATAAAPTTNTAALENFADKAVGAAAVQPSESPWTARPDDEALEPFLQAEEVPYVPPALFVGLVHEEELLERPSEINLLP